MRIVIPSVVFLCGIASASSLPADVPVTSAQANPKTDRVVCRREETVGTLFSKSVCMTQSQWKQRDQMARDGKDQMIQEVNRRAIDNPNPAGPGGK